jgi:Beta/Gamma crystallin
MRSKRFCMLAAGVLALTAGSAFAGQVTLYEGQGFRGRAAVATDQVPALGTTIIGGGASSVVVTEGTWEACTETNFRGRCGQLLPGNYSALSVNLSGPVFSVRQIQSVSSRIAVTPDTVAVGPAPAYVVTHSAPAYVVANPAPATVVVNPTPAVVVSQPAQVVTTAPVVTTAQIVAVAPRPPGRAVLYQFPNFGGPAAVVEYGRMPDLDWANFRYPAASLRIESGNWVACTEMGYRGECRVLGPGDYPALTGGLDRGISSLRPVA